MLVRGRKAEKDSKDVEDYDGRGEPSEKNLFERFILKPVRTNET